MNESTYRETYRPQFHFTARQGWINDPNGLVFYQGEYHLFFQHNPAHTDWGNIHWGHAVSTDLVHWKQIDNAIAPDALGMIFSGSAVVDWHNTSGLQTGSEKPLVAFYTAFGRDLKPPVLDSNCLTYSNDRGRTWTKYAGNPIVPHIVPGNRDPKVFWHAPTRKWVMCLYIAERNDAGVLDTIRFLSSPDLKHWTPMGRMDGFFECPDMFELAVDGNAANRRWVLFAADGRYVVGQFDGHDFHAESGKHSLDWGGNCYAGQTFSDIPAADGRRILMAWMFFGNYPDMPFNQQLTFPCALSLRTFPEGIRLCKYPVREIAHLHGQSHEWRDVTVKPHDNPLAGVTGVLFDIEAEIELGNAIEFGFVMREQKVCYVAGDHDLFCLGRAARLEPVQGRIHLRILVDRTSIEVFGNDGRVASTTHCLLKPQCQKLAFYSSAGTTKLISLRVRELKSAWET